MIEPSMMTLLAGQLALLLGLGCVLARVTEWLGQPRLVGALFAGVLVGPLVLGSVAPDWHQRAMVGASAEREALHAMEKQNAEELNVAESIEVTSVYIDNLKEQHAARIAPLREAVAVAARDAQRPLKWTVLIAIVIGIVATSRHGALYAARDALAQPAVAGLVGVVLCGAATCWLVRLFGFTPVDESANAELWLMGVVVGCAATAAPLLPGARARLADEPPLRLNVDAMLFMATLFMLVLAGLLAIDAGRPDSAAVAAGDETRLVMNWTTLGIDAAVIAALIGVFLFVLPSVVAKAGTRWVMREVDAGSAAVIVAVVTLALMWMAADLKWHIAAGAMIAAAVFAAQPVLARRIDAGLAPIADYVAEPLVLAYIGSQLTFTDFNWWLALLLLILFGDGKATGAMAAAWFTQKRSALQSLEVGTAIATGGFVPLVVALLLHESGVIDTPVFAALVLANVVTAVLSGPMIGLSRSVWRDDDKPENA